MMVQTLTGFPRPTLDSLIGTRRTALLGSLGSATDKTVTEALSFALATTQNDLHGHVDWMLRMMHPLYAEGPWLEAWGQGLVGLRTRAGRASGLVTLTGLDGARILKGTIIRRKNDGFEYVNLETTTIVKGRASVAVQAVVAGTAGNAAVGEALALVTPAEGLNTESVVGESGLYGGADSESDDHYRSRYLTRLRNKTTGGDDSDWIAWMKEVPGVTDAWISPHELGVGSVVCRFLMRDDRASFGGVPQGDGAPYYTGDLKVMFDHLESRRPAGMRQMIVMAPSPYPLEVTVYGLSPDTESVRAAIRAELEDVVRRKWQPNARLIDGQSPAILFRHTWIADALAAAAGHDHWQRYSPAEDISLTLHQVPVLGDVIYA